MRRHNVNKLLITPASIAAIDVGFQTIFQSAWGATETFWDQLATPTTSSTLSDVYGAMAMLPTMREWIGARLIANIDGHAQTITNKDWELTMAVKRTQIEDDSLGFTRPKLEMMALQGAKLYDYLLVDAIEANIVGFDGLSFFNTAHTLDPTGVQSNDLSGKPLTSANYAEARATMRKFSAENGKPIGTKPNLLVVPSALEQRGLEILKATTIADPGGAAAGVTNVMANTADLLVIDELASDVEWYLFKTDLPVKPWIRQERQPVRMVSMTDVTDTNVFHLNQFEWGIDGRGAIGPGPWFLGLRASA